MTEFFKNCTQVVSYISEHHHEFTRKYPAIFCFVLFCFLIRLIDIEHANAEGLKEAVIKAYQDFLELEADAKVDFSSLGLIGAGADEAKRRCAMASSSSLCIASLGIGHKRCCEEYMLT